MTYITNFVIIFHEKDVRAGLPLFEKNVLSPDCKGNEDTESFKGNPEDGNEETFSFTNMETKENKLIKG